MNGTYDMLEKYTHSVILFDHNWQLFDCNHLFLKVTGYSLEQLRGAAIETVIGNISQYVKDQPGQEALCGSVPTEPAVIQTAEGRRLYSSFLVTQLGSGEHDGGILIQLPDLAPAGEMQLMQHFAGTLMQDVNLGVLLFDANFVLVDISDMACRILGFDKVRVVNESMETVFASVPVDHWLVQKSVFDGIVVRNRAVSWMNNRDRYELLLDTNLLKDTAGTVVGGYIIFKDVTNLRSLEEQVQRSDRLAMIGQIAAGAAHEIRNPLTSIKGFMQVFKNTFAEKEMEKERNYTEIMLTEIDRINELVSEFLLLSKRKSVSYGSVDLQTVWKEIMPIIESEALLHSISVRYEGLGNLPEIIADREMLKQVFLNIGKNGIEAMSEGGTLTISDRVDLKERKVIVDIHDTGPGIPNYIIDKIFDPFFTTKQDGTGLGLSVCQRIVHDMGGMIRVSSKGFGTTFSVSIPLP